MILTSQKGAGLIMALMLAHGAPAEAPQGATEVAEPAPREMLIAAGDEATRRPDEEAVAGAFRELPEDEQARARRLLEAQRITPDSGPAWSLDRIAAMRQSGKDWERIVVLLQRKRLVAAGSPAEILGEPEAPRAVAETQDEALTGAIGTAGGPDGERAITTGLSSEIACPVPGRPALAAAPAEGE